MTHVNRLNVERVLLLNKCPAFIMHFKKNHSTKIIYFFFTKSLTFGGVQKTFEAASTCCVRYCLLSDALRKVTNVQYCCIQGRMSFCLQLSNLFPSGVASLETLLSCRFVSNWLEPLKSLRRSDSGLISTVHSSSY